MTNIQSLQKHTIDSSKLATLLASDRTKRGTLRVNVKRKNHAKKMGKKILANIESHDVQLDNDTLKELAIKQAIADSRENDSIGHMTSEHAIEGYQQITEETVKRAIVKENKQNLYEYGTLRQPTGRHWQGLTIPNSNGYGVEINGLENRHVNPYTTGYVGKPDNMRLQFNYHRWPLPVSGALQAIQTKKSQAVSVFSTLDISALTRQNLIAMQSDIQYALDNVSLPNLTSYFRELLATLKAEIENKKPDILASEKQANSRTMRSKKPKVNVVIHAGIVCLLDRPYNMALARDASRNIVKPYIWQLSNPAIKRIAKLTGYAIDASITDEIIDYNGFKIAVKML